MFTAPPTDRAWTVAELLPPGTTLDTFLPGTSAAADVTALDHAAGSPATGGVLRVRSGERSFVVKVLHHLRHWPVLPLLPPAFAQEFAAEFPWRAELALWEPSFTDALPDGLRVPVLHGVAELGDDRIAVWMEDVRQLAPDPETLWTHDRYGRAAHLLGRFAARRATPEVLAACTWPTGHGLRKFAVEGLPGQLQGVLDDESRWAEGPLRAAADLRPRLLAWREEIPGLLDALDALPQSIPHGDASEQNLLVPAADDGCEFVAIDCAFQSPQALGFDLGQLLVGYAQVGLVPVDGLEARRDLVVREFSEGLRAEGLEPHGIEFSFAAALLVRSGFTNLPSDAQDPATAATKIALTRFVLDTADAWCPRG